MEVFLKRAERPFKEKIGEEKAISLLNKIKKASNEIPAKFRRVIGSEIPKYLFNFSQEIEELNPEITEGVLYHVLGFAQSLKELINRDRNEVNQMLTKRSNNKIRTQQLVGPFSLLTVTARPLKSMSRLPGPVYTPSATIIVSSSLASSIAA